MTGTTDPARDTDPIPRSDPADALLLQREVAGLPGASAAFSALAASSPADPLVTFHLNRIRSGASDTTIVMTEK